MKRPKIKTALVASFMLMGLIFSGFATYAVLSLQATNTYVSELATNWMPSADLAQTLALNVSQLRSAYRDHILSTDDAGRSKAETRIGAVSNSLQSKIRDYDSLDTGHEDAKTTDEIRANLLAYASAGAQVLELSRQGQDDRAIAALYGELSPIGDRVSAAAAKLVEANKARAEEAFAGSQKVYHRSLLLALIAIGSSLAFIACSIWFALVGIARPIQNITASMKRLADGDTASTVPYEGRADEIGQMAAAVEVFRANAVANLRLEQEAAATRSLSEDERQRKAAAERARAEEMAQATAGLGEGLKHLAGGDLTFQLSEPFAADFETLRLDFNGAVSQLAETLRAVADAASAIDTGSREVSASADDLSRRTEQQAASLEETAAALDQITVNVANSSKRADEGCSAGQ